MNKILPLTATNTREWHLSVYHLIHAAYWVTVCQRLVIVIVIVIVIVVY